MSQPNTCRRIAPRIAAGTSRTSIVRYDRQASRHFAGLDIASVDNASRDRAGAALIDGGSSARARRS